MKYTIIYQAYVGMGHYLVQAKRIKTDNLKAWLKEHDDIDAQFIFDGWPKLEDGTNPELF